VKFVGFVGLMKFSLFMLFMPVMLFTGNMGDTGSTGDNPPFCSYGVASLQEPTRSAPRARPVVVALWPVVAALETVEQGGFA